MIATDTFTLGDRPPSRSVEPTDAAGVAAALHAADGAGEAVVAFGGATLQSIGNAPNRYDVAISLRGLNRMIAYDPRDMTFGAEAGATIASVAQVLGDAGQFVPFDVPHPHVATIGGTLATGWNGPRRTTYGRLRDLLIGSTVALTDGTLATAGGMVVKNVTGYDMGKLYVGSLGTLALLTRANFKALPRAAHARLALAPLPDDARERVAHAIAELEIAPTAALMVNGFFGATPRVRDEAARLLVLFEGSESVIERATRDIRSALGAAGVPITTLIDGNAAERAFQSVIDAYVENVSDRSVTFRSTGHVSTVLPRAYDIAKRTSERSLGCDWIADLCTGDAVVRLVGRSHDAIAQTIRDIATDVRAIAPSATLLAGDPTLRARIDAWGTPPTTLATMRALKRRFDPTATLAPGRYVGGL